MFPYFKYEKSHFTPAKRMDSYLGLRLKLTLKDSSIAEGIVNSINDSAQKISLTDVKLTPFGSTSGASFPELTLLAGNIEDVEILPGSSSVGKNSSKKQQPQQQQQQSKSKKTSTPSAAYINNSLYATPSVYADKTHTFPSGNARSILPNEEFDFISNLARFDKADEFRKIQAEDSVPKGDRLVSINSPQRKLGVNESVLDGKEKVTAVKVKKNNDVTSQLNETKTTTTNTDVIMDKFKHLSLPPTSTAKKILVEGSSDDDEVEEDKKIKINKDKSNNSINEPAAALNCAIPTIPSGLFDKFCLDPTNSSLIESFRSVGSLNFAHHLLAELDVNSQVVLLLGVGDGAAMLMETFYHLLNHSRMKKLSVLAIFAAGAPGSNGKRIELTPAVKSARKLLMSLERVQFTSSLSDVIKLQDPHVTIFDALGPKGELTPNAQKGLTDWITRRLLLGGGASGMAGKIIYCIEGSSLLAYPSHPSMPSAIQLVTFGVARDDILSHLPLTRSILYVDTGISEKMLEKIIGHPLKDFDLYSESFVCELEYNI